MCYLRVGIDEDTQYQLVHMEDFDQWFLVDFNPASGAGISKLSAEEVERAVDGIRESIEHARQNGQDVRVLHDSLEEAYLDPIET